MIQRGRAMDRLLSMQVFERVADEGGFAAAARAMDLSPPVVTRLIADIEAYLGTRLFQRTTRRVPLTERSEEHTSELQSLMRISYAVFCLKKKNTTNPHLNKHNRQYK